MEKRVSGSEALNYGWEVFRRYIPFFVILVLAIAAAYVIGQRIIDPLPGILEFAARLALIAFLQMVAIRALLGTHDQLRPPPVRRLVLPLAPIGRLVIVLFLYILILVAGFLLLVIPAIVWGIRFQFAPYLVLDEGLGPIDALRRSYRITRGAGEDLLIFALLVIVVNLVGFAALIAGLLATLPTTAIAHAWIYRRLRQPPTKEPPAEA